VAVNFWVALALTEVLGGVTTTETSETPFCGLLVPPPGLFEAVLGAPLQEMRINMQRVAKIEVTAFTGGSPDGFAIELDFPKVGRRFSARAPAACGG
jgi:hypothetical protein